MAKSHTRFVCSHCGAFQSKWMGKCPDCGEWNSLSEQVVHDIAEDRHRPLVSARGEDGPLVVPVGQIEPDTSNRWTTGLSEFDRVLGGGIVPGSAVLIGGDPGIGKSTLLLQAGQAMARLGRKTLYVTSEESLGQVRLRADRLDGDKPPKTSHELRVSAQANLDIISNILSKERPDVVVIDSVQMVYRPEVAAAPGSAAQLRDAAARLIWLAKQMGFALVLVGHVTKDGAIAGPKILEHLVDCVIYFEGDRYHAHRLIRTVKNRFGSTDEIGIFEMTSTGLLGVDDPSRMFLATQRAARPGSVVLAACEGTRTLLVEVQALTSQSVFGSAKRKATGVDSNRVSMILAVLEKHGDIVLGDQDVFVNIVGGVRVNEPAADLAVALAVHGAFTGRGLPESTVVCGELGLGGELRPVNHQRQRMSEARRIGFQKMIVPATSGGGSKEKRAASTDLEILTCETVGHAIRHLS